MKNEILNIHVERYIIDNWKIKNVRRLENNE